LWAGALIGVALFWWIAIAPALHTWRAAPAQHQSLDAQLQTLQSLQAQALDLQANRNSTPTDRVAALRTTVTQQLGASANLQVAGDLATVTLQNATASSLAQWLSQARSNARATPIEARLNRSNIAPNSSELPNSGAANQNNATPLWSGSVVLQLPGI
jgi:general secretion pathway protein M